MGPLECLECSRECSGPFEIVTVVIGGIVGIKWLEGRIRVPKLLLVFLTPAHFLFMSRETALVDMTSHIPKIVDVRSDILVDFLVMLVRVVDMVPPSSPRGVVRHHDAGRQNCFCQGGDWILA